ncbi:hypothetical protein L5515_011610 [Caenorhabditis briggsae]|uniref:Uncharacterized protein n=1 Tax=Caenorhabditis briggsae TaxID=6238 RepID=A0AAE9EXX1_CAEBR|nr:hypothetical protein L5515_011610 [Caenorhabditis briggsae]
MYVCTGGVGGGKRKGNESRREDRVALFTGPCSKKDVVVASPCALRRRVPSLRRRREKRSHTHNSMGFGIGPIVCMRKEKKTEKEKKKERLFPSLRGKAQRRLQEKKGEERGRDDEQNERKECIKFCSS